MPPTYRFADLTLHTERYSVERDGVRIDLPKLSYEFLLALVRAAPNLLTHEDIVEKVWAGRVVSPETITQRIKLLRDALGDDASRPRYIGGIRGRGYRLIPEVVRPPLERASINRTRRRIWVAGTVSLAAVLSFWALRDYLGSTRAPQRTPSIAILPFENFSADPEDAYFAAGIHNELLARLARISNLKVISRTSVLEYEGRPRNLRDIGNALGVTTILEGSVQRIGDTVRINMQLIDAATDAHLWADTYERKLTAENLFSIQTDIATSIVVTLQAVLLPDDAAQLNEIPTKSIRAYDFYLSGNDYFGRAGSEGVELAVQQYQRAVEEDSQFAQAWAQLSRSHSLMAWSGRDRTDSRWELALAAAESAFELVPDLPEAHVALGQYHYMASRDYDRALEEFALAAKKSMGTAEIFQLRAFIQRRIGAWDEALENMSRAIDLDPRNIDLLDQQAQNFRILRDYEQAELLWDRILEIAPDHTGSLQNKAVNALYRGDPIAEVREALERSSSRGVGATRLRWLVALFERDYDRAHVLLEEWDVDTHLTGLHYIPKASYRGVTDFLAGQRSDARRWFEMATLELRDALASSPDDWRIHLSLGEALAALGQADEAVQLARRALDLYPASSDTFSAHTLQTQAALRVFIPAGDHDAALAELEAYFAVPGRWSIEGLVRDPRLDPIRNNPRFQALVEKYKRSD